MVDHTQEYFTSKSFIKILNLPLMCWLSFALSAESDNGLQADLVPDPHTNLNTTDSPERLG